MAENDNNRRDDAALDANLSVLGEEGNEPNIGRVGSAPKPQNDTDMEQELDGGSASQDDGNIDPIGQKAARESARDAVDGFGKTPTSR